MKKSLRLILLFLSTTLPATALLLIANFLWIENTNPSWELYMVVSLASPALLSFSLLPLFQWLKKQEKRYLPLHDEAASVLRSVLIVGCTIYGIGKGIGLIGDNKAVTRSTSGDFFHQMAIQFLLVILPIAVGAISFFLVNGLIDAFLRCWCNAFRPTAHLIQEPQILSDSLPTDMANFNDKTDLPHNYLIISEQEQATPLQIR